MGNKIKKKGQVAIFIIIAIVLIAIILLFFILKDKIGINQGRQPVKSPESFLETCMEDAMTETVDILLRQGGYVNPKVYRNFKFAEEPNANNIAFLCYNKNYYFPCITQYPMFVSDLKKEIKDEVSDDVVSCFRDYTKSLDDQGYTVTARNPTKEGIEIILQEEHIVILAQGEITMTKTGETTKEENFQIRFPTRLYSLALIAQEIVDQEAKYCSFNSLGYTLLYPKWKIDVLVTGEGTKIYTVEHKITGENLRFAVRGCVFPAGIG